MSDLPVVNIGICGLGTVGQGVWKHITRSSAKLESRLGAKLVLKKASVRDLAKKRSVRVGKSRMTTDPMSIATDPSIQIVCELIGGTTLAKDLTLAALRMGKTVISANKALVCGHGPEIFAAARQHGGHYFFEASVAGGIPIIKALREGLVANRFDRIYGILNGTCNYILTRMEREGLSYPEILTEAKALGYAEADESLDVDGWDTAHKASILAYLAHGTWVPTKSMVVEGITKITQADIHYAAQNGYAIKLLALITRDLQNDQLAVSVAPTLLPRTKVLANVNEVYNGISVAGDVVGETVYIGRGAATPVFESLDPKRPANFYLLSYPAHVAHPNHVLRFEGLAGNHLGSSITANERTIYKYFAPGLVTTCQLVMGLTLISPGSVWNTMPPHTHLRRSEVYCYCELAPDSIVMHFMGPPDATRHLVVRSGQAVVSPSWSIHAGAGTGAYAFVWGMGGENQAFDDMDRVAFTDLM